MRPIHHSRPDGAKKAIFINPTDLASQYAEQRAEQPTGYRFCSDNVYIRNDIDDVPGVLKKAFMSLPTQKSFALYFALNPTSRRALPDMAHSLQSDHYVSLYSIWDDDVDDARCTGWVHDMCEYLMILFTGSVFPLLHGLYPSYFLESWWEQDPRTCLCFTHAHRQGLD